MRTFEPDRVWRDNVVSPADPAGKPSLDSPPSSRPQMEKTEKTMAEMEVDQNLAWEFSSITEKGHRLEPLSGPG